MLNSDRDYVVKFTAERLRIHLLNMDTLNSAGLEEKLLEAFDEVTISPGSKQEVRGYFRHVWQTFMLALEEKLLKVWREMANR